MMAKKRKVDRRPISCDCSDVHQIMPKRIFNIKKRQREWKRIYIKDDVSLEKITCCHKTKKEVGRT